MDKSHANLQIWKTRSAQLDDAMAIESFLVSVPEFTESLKRNEQINVWKWLFVRNDKTVKDVYIAENNEGNIIAHYGLAVLPYKLDKSKVEAGLACLLAIDQDFRKTHLFIQLTNKLYKQFRAGGGSFLTALVNRAGLFEFHKAFGFVVIGEVPIYVKPVDIETIAKKFLSRRFFYPFTQPCLAIINMFWNILFVKRLAPMGRISIQSINSFDDNIVSTVAQIARYHLFFADRSDREILNNRFFSLNCRNYEVYSILEDKQIIGYVVLRKMYMRGLSTLAIVDICFDFSRKDVARAVLKSIDLRALESSVELISILISSQPLINQLRKNFYFKAPESFKLMVLEPSKFFALNKSRINDWFITWFEHDFV